MHYYVLCLLRFDAFKKNINIKFLYMLVGRQLYSVTSTETMISVLLLSYLEKGTEYCLCAVHHFYQIILVSVIVSNRP